MFSSLKNIFNVFSVNVKKMKFFKSLQRLRWCRSEIESIDCYSFENNSLSLHITTYSRPVCTEAKLVENLFEFFSENAVYDEVDWGIECDHQIWNMTEQNDFNLKDLEYVDY